MSRRKVRGLTRTGRQVSEDPDIDNLLSTLSPEEMEELEKEVLTVPDTDPSETVGFTTGSRLGKQPSLNNNTEARQDQHETKRLPRRELSVEGEPKKESRKQEYLRKMGLSQEGSLSRSTSQDGGPQCQGSVSSEGEHDKTEERTCREPGDPKEDRRTFLGRTQAVGSREVEKGNEREEDSKKKMESNSSKTKDLISKLQEKKEEGKERDKREEGRKREEGKTKELISRLREKNEKEESKERESKDEMRWKEDRKSRGLVSRFEKKQSQGKEDGVAEVKKDTGEEKSNGEQPDEPKEKDRHERKDEESERVEKKVVRDEEEKEKKQKENTNEKERDEKKGDKDQENESGKGKPSRLSTSEKAGNGQSPSGKTAEEEEDDEASSMFDELLEKVRTNDPATTELNVNNSEVIKTKTLIQLAEALRDNTHVKTFALANTRADDHVAYAIAGILRVNKTVASVNLDSNHLTGKGIMALTQALLYNSSLTELRFHNQRHICGGKTEMEMAKVLKENTTLLKLGYHFELAGPRMTVTNILSRNMDRQRQRRLQEQRQAQADGEKKGGGGALEVPKPGGGFLRGSPKASPKGSPQPSPLPSPVPSPKVTPKRGRGGGAGGGVGGGAPPPPAPPPPPPPAPLLDGDFLRNSLSPASQRKLDDRGAGLGGGKNSRDQLLASIRGSNLKKLKKVTVPKLLQ